MFAKLMAAIDGYKSYILLAILGILAFINGTEGTLDLGALLSNAELLETELMLALIAAGRSAIGKIGKA